MESKQFWKSNVMLCVCFSPKLVAVLREVKYLCLHQENMTIPDIVVDLYATREKLRQYQLNLHLITDWYLFLRQDVDESEAALIAEEMKTIEAKLLEAVNQLNWQSNGRHFLNSLPAKLNRWNSLLLLMHDKLMDNQIGHRIVSLSIN